MSLNLFVRALALNVALVLAVREATDLGDEIIGAHTIAINLWLFAAFFIDGYGAAGNIMGGKLLGAKDYNGLWKLTRRIAFYGGTVGLVLMGLGFLFYSSLGRLFSNEALVLNAFYAVFYIVLLAFPMNTVAFVLDGLFKGLGEMKYLRKCASYRYFFRLCTNTLLRHISRLGIARYLDCFYCMDDHTGQCLGLEVQAKISPTIAKGLILSKTR